MFNNNPRYKNLSLKTGESFYSCWFQGGFIDKNRPLNLWSRYHKESDDVNVRQVHFEYCNMEKIPRGLAEKFVNLKILNIYQTQLSEISKNDLIEYRNLERFYCNRNKLEILPGDLFEGFQNLQFISFAENDLKIIESNILDGLNNLKHVNFLSNPNYNKCFSVYQVYKPNATLNEVKDELMIKYGTSMAKLKTMNDILKTNKKLQDELLCNSEAWYFENRRIKSENNNLMEENHELEKSKEQMKLENKDLKQQLSQLNESEEKMKLEITNLKAVKPQTGLDVDINAYIQNEATKDFKIIINEQEIPVHKFILAARSSALAELFQKDPDAIELKLVDLPLEVFELILKFIYTDELPGDDDTNFLSLFAAAGKLKIEKLIKHSSTKIIDQVDQDNALMIYQVSSNFELNELKDRALDELKNKYKEIDFNEELLENPNNVIKAIKKFIKKEETKLNSEEEINISTVDQSTEDSNSGTNEERP